MCSLPPDDPPLTHMYSSNPNAQPSALNTTHTAAPFNLAVALTGFEMSYRHSPEKVLEIGLAGGGYSGGGMEHNGRLLGGCGG